MAKIQRILRKRTVPIRRAFDEQLWPVLLALCVLAGFTMGSILAYLRFDAPRWYSNAATWLSLTALFTISLAVALAYVENRVFRRSMQLAIVLCLLFHAMMLIVSLELRLFDRVQELLATQSDLAERREPVTLPVYFESPRRDQLRQEFEQPVEIETPAPERELEVPREPVERAASVPQVQPEPVPEVETSPRPARVRRAQAEETRPRYSDQPAQLSRRTSQIQPRPPSTQAGELAQTPAAQPRELTARESQLARRETPAQLPRRDPATEPALTEPATELRMARRTDTPEPEVQESATPALSRQMAPPVSLPRTAVDLDAPAAASQQTETAPLQPQTTLAQRQAMATPTPDAPPAEPVPDTRVPDPQMSQQRQLRPEPRPERAQTPIDLPTRQPRTTPRPDAVTAAREPRVADPAEPTPQDQVQPTTLPLARAQTDTPPARQPAAAEPVTAAEIAAATPPAPARAAAERAAAAEPDHAPTTRPRTPRAEPDAPPTETLAAASPAAEAEPAEPADQLPAPAEAAVAAQRQTPAEPARAAQATPAEPVAAPPETPAPPTLPRTRAETSPEAVAAAPATIPRPAAASPSPAVRAAAEALERAAPAPDTTAEAPAARELPATRHQTSPSATDHAAELAARAESPGAPESAAAAHPASPARTRLPRGEPAEQLARAETSAPTRRQTPAALPQATTVPVEVTGELAAAEAAQDQLRPSAARLARQPVAQPAAERSQPAREAPSAARTPQIAPPALARTETPSVPSALPDSPSPQPPARAALQSPLPATPTAVESPALAETTRGASDPAAQPARTAMNRALTGTAGIGAGRNLDRARPAADSPAMIASAAARRAEATQDTPPGPDLAPATPALERRALADQPRPAASLQAQPTDALATAAGAEQPAELAASASASVRQAAAEADAGSIAAARGTTAVDVGPTQIVSEGQLGRASGGGQPVLNPDTESPELARSDRAGGAPRAAVEAATLVEAAMAPDGDGGGQPPTPETEMPATAVARTDPGGEAALAGGPAWAERTGAPSEVSRAAEPSEPSLTRAELAEAVPDPAAPGGGQEEDEDEEERRRRLARAAARLAALDLPTTAEELAMPGESAEPAEAPRAEATGPAIARAEPAAAVGGPRDAEPAAEPAAASAASVSDATARRAVAPDAAGPPAVAADPPAAPARSPRAPRMPDADRLAAAISAPAADQPAEAAPPALAAAVSTQREATAAASAPAAADIATRVPDTPVSSTGNMQPVARADASRAPSGAGDEPVAGLARRTAATAPPLPETAAAATGGEIEGPPADLTELESQLAAAPLATRRGGPTNPVAESALPALDSGQQPGASGPSLTGAPVRRAEAVEATVGSPVPGGGAQRPARAARGPALAVPTEAEMVQIAGSPDSGGIPDSTPLAAQGVEAARRTGGVRAPPQPGAAGAMADDDTLDVAALRSPGSGRTTRSASPSTQPGPAIDDLATAGPLERTDRHDLPFGAINAQMIELPDASGDAAVGQATVDHNLAAQVRAQPVRRQAAEGGLAVRMDAPSGPGGLGHQPATDVGIPHRRASRDRVQVAARTARFARRDMGGQPDSRTAAIVAAPPFQQRAERGDPGGRPGGAPPPMTEEAIERGLAFLARQQLPDGSWSFQGVDQASAALVSDTAATALALLAFQGAGYHHRDYKYADRVAAAIRQLVENQREDGDLFVPLDDESNRSVWIYSHSLAALALTEAYGMTQDPELREPAQRAIDFLLEAQHPERGGWRYSPATGSDTSVTGWAMMALKSGELANLEVPQEAYEKIRSWLNVSQDSQDQPHLYRYNPFAPDTAEQRHGRVPSLSMTSVGLLMRLYLGWHRDQPDMQRGADYLTENLPQLGSSRRPLRDTYYWYYATQVMFHMGGDYWQQWNEALHPLLVNSQVRQGAMAGSWDPRQPLPDRWAPHAGRLYVTTMNLLSLEVYYRHLPLYDDTAR